MINFAGMPVLVVTLSLLIFFRTEFTFPFLVGIKCFNALLFSEV